jgi:hypothetical protein
VRSSLLKFNSYQTDEIVQIDCVLMMLLADFGAKDEHCQLGHVTD